VSSEAVVVRPVRPEEWVAVGDLCVAAYAADGLGPGGYAATLRDVEARVRAASVFVAEVAGCVVGAVTLMLSASPLREIAAEDEAEFRMLAVDPAAQGRGVGRALVLACADAARSGGFRTLVCSSQDRMAAAHRVYERLGFERDPGRDWSPVEGVRLLAFSLALRESARQDYPTTAA
jgi:ribosomal protein S18 acetylase RimI-like enzyme